MKNSSRSTPLRGSVRVPGDKSISHRALMLGALADGASRVEGFLPSTDCLATLSCIRALGVEVELDGPTSLTILGRGLDGLRQPGSSLNCHRSGTTMRLMAGILSGQPFRSILTGDAQLLRRPMMRIVEPLRRMGAEITHIDGHGPLTVCGGPLQGQEHRLTVASGQVKSALLLAGLMAQGPTTIHQPGPARDHSERMMEAMGANVIASNLTVTLHPSSLSPLAIQVPGDISSGVFPLVAAILIPKSEITLQGVGVNPTRVGLLDVLREMGADLVLSNQRIQGNESVADVTGRTSELRGVEIGGTTVVRMIDEFPVLAVAATQAEGTTRVRNAVELRVKETDRIATLFTELRKLGACIEPLSDGFVVEGPTRLQGGVVNSHDDHRLAMALFVAGLIAEGKVSIEGTGCIGDSFPGFFKLMTGLGASND